jgi:hypothetical protein
MGDHSRKEQEDHPDEVDDNEEEENEEEPLIDSASARIVEYKDIDPRIHVILGRGTIFPNTITTTTTYPKSSSNSSSCSSTCSSSTYGTGENGNHEEEEDHSIPNDADEADDTTEEEEEENLPHETTTTSIYERVLWEYWERYECTPHAQKRNMAQIVVKTMQQRGCIFLQKRDDGTRHGTKNKNNNRTHAHTLLISFVFFFFFSGYYQVVPATSDVVLRRIVRALRSTVTNQLQEMTWEQKQERRKQQKQKRLHHHKPIITPFPNENNHPWMTTTSTHSTSTMPTVMIDGLPVLPPTLLLPTHSLETMVMATPSVQQQQQQDHHDAAADPQAWPPDPLPTDEPLCWGMSDFWNPPVEVVGTIGSENQNAKNSISHQQPQEQSFTTAFPKILLPSSSTTTTTTTTATVLDTTNNNDFTTTTTVPGKKHADFNGNNNNNRKNTIVPLLQPPNLLFKPSVGIDFANVFADLQNDPDIDDDDDDDHPLPVRFGHSESSSSQQQQKSNNNNNSSILPPMLFFHQSSSTWFGVASSPRDHLVRNQSIGNNHGSSTIMGHGVAKDWHSIETMPFQQRVPSDSNPTSSDCKSCDKDNKSTFLRAGCVPARKTLLDDDDEEEDFHNDNNLHGGPRQNLDGQLVRPGIMAPHHSFRTTPAATTTSMDSNMPTITNRMKSSPSPFPLQDVHKSHSQMIQNNNHHHHKNSHTEEQREKSCMFSTPCELGPVTEDYHAVAAPIPAYPEPFRCGRRYPIHMNNNTNNNNRPVDSSTAKEGDDDDDEDGVVLIEKDENALRQKLLDITRQLGDITRHVKPLQSMNDRLWRQVVVHSEEKVTPKRPTRGRTPNSNNKKSPNRNAKKRRVSS